MNKILILLFLVCMFVTCGEVKKEEIKPDEVVEKVIFNGTFLEVLNKATELVKAEKADAIFAEADATMKDSSMTVNDILGWKFIYWIDIQNSMIIEYKDSTFSNITAMPYPILEDYIIREPIKMDIVEAVELMRKANYDGLIKFCTLKKPLFPGSKEPYYIFGSEKYGHIFVGTISKTVTIDKFPEEKGKKKK